MHYQFDNEKLRVFASGYKNIRLKIKIKIIICVSSEIKILLITQIVKHKNLYVMTFPVLKSWFYDDFLN